MQKTSQLQPYSLKDKARRNSLLKNNPYDSKQKIRQVHHHFFQGPSSSNIKIFWTVIAQKKKKFSIKDIFSNGEQIHRNLADMLRFTEEILTENSIFCAVSVTG